MPDKPNCYECKYRGKVPGDAHSCCKYPGNATGMFDLLSGKNLRNAAKLNIKGDAHGIARGWFMWPVNYDPTWLLRCNGFEKKGDSA